MNKKDQSNREQDAPATPRLRFPEFRDAEGWEVKTLKDTCQMQAGKFVAASDIKEQNEGNFFPCYGGNGLRGFTATSTHEGVYPLIGRQGALCGNVKLASGKFHATEHALVATPRQKVELVWLYYVLNLLNLNRFATGQAQPGLSVDVLEKISVAIPPTLPEQQRIADCLSSLDALITAQARKVDALKSHKKGLMQQLFPRTGETQPRLRFPEFRDTPSWTKTTVSKITDTIISGGTPSTTEKNFWGGGIRWMNSGELNDKKVQEVKGRITREGLKNSSTKLIPPQCVLIGLAGQGKTRGTVAINLVELCINQSIAAIFPNNSTFDSDFLYHELDKRYDELRRLSSGGEGRGGLNLQIIKSLNLALPTLAEQQRIADCLSSLDDLITAATRQLATLKTHKQGLMQQLFPNVAGASSSADIHTREQDAPATHP
jgi:type I restriction enzyme S subunit